MSRHIFIPRNSVIPEAHEIIQTELRDFDPEIMDIDADTYASYSLCMGPFAHVDYDSVHDKPFPQNNLQWQTTPEELAGQPPEKLVQVGNQIIRLRDEMGELGYSFETVSEFTEYEVQLNKPVDLDKLAAEVRQVRDRYANWKG